MNQQWYQSAVDLMLSRSAWDVMELAEKFTQILDSDDPIQPNFQTWFTTLFIAGDRGNIPGDNVLKTQHIVESLLDPDFNRDILVNYPEGAVFPSREKLRNAILQSDYLEYVPEIKSLATLHYVDRSADDTDTLIEQLTFEQRKNQILEENRSHRKWIKGLKVVIDLQSKHGKDTESWTEREWHDRCYEAANALFLDSSKKKNRIGTEGFHSFWLFANPLRKKLFCLIQLTSTENSTSQ
jgi:hypothetical protein